MRTQKLQAKLKNVPVDASQVHCSTSSVLNKEEIPSVQDKVLTCNNLDGNLPQHTGGQNLIVSAVVYVLNMKGSPLMSTSPVRAKKLLRSGEAKVVKLSPFTIQMRFLMGGSKQEIILGIDSGYKNIGYSCKTSKKELFADVVILDTKTKERLAERKSHRRNRRSKLWYREPRFNNRKKGSNWLPPSVKRNYDAHITMVHLIEKLLPITKTVVEIGNFDIQKLGNPEIQGKEYQQGNSYGFQNVKAFIIYREKGNCQFCGKEKGNDVFQLHHIDGRQTGSNSPDNLALVHSKCHDKIHKKHLEKTLKKNKSYREATFMNVVKDKFQKDLGCETTYGYITYAKRLALGLPKTHYNDAFVIASGTNQIRAIPMSVVQKRKNNRSVQLNRKGFAPSIRKKRYPHQPKDLVWVGGKKYEVVGTHCYGKSVIVKNPNAVKHLDFSVKKIEKHFRYNSLVFQGKIIKIQGEMVAIPPHD